MGHDVTETTARHGARATLVPTVGPSLAWEARLYPAMRSAVGPREARAALAEALGMAGVEAEFFLDLVEGFGADGRPSRAAGETFLRQLEAAGGRMLRVASDLEIAVQGFVASYGAGNTGVGRAEGDDTPWWPEDAALPALREPLELALRRCGFAYRHVVAVRLDATVEAIAEQMALTLLALRTIPPGGTVPAHTLTLGLLELAAAWQGDVAQRHLLDVSGEYPGLLRAVRDLRARDRQQDTSLAADLRWAHTQYALAHAALAGLAQGLAAQAAPPRASSAAFASVWAGEALGDWQQIITALERLARAGAVTGAPRR